MRNTPRLFRKTGSPAPSSPPDLPRFGKKLFALLLLGTALHSPALQAQTQRNWIGGNGTELDWALPANWQGSNVPVSPDYFAQFLAGTSAKINVPGGSSTARMTLDGNTDIELVLGSTGGAFTLDALLRVGNTNAGAAHLKFTGTGTLEGNSFNIGASAASADGNSLTFAGSTSISFTGVNATSYVGRFGSNNLLSISNGNTNRLSTLYIGYEGGDGNNRAVISGAGTTVIVQDSGSNRGVRIGSVTAGTSYATGMQNNYIEIKSGARLALTSNGANSNQITIGGQAYAHGNSLTIEGEGSTLELRKGAATIGDGATITIGNSDQSNRGGNSVKVSHGGSIVSEAGHAGNITIYGHDSSGENAGANSLVIGDEGRVAINGNIVINGGSVILSATGELSAGNITVGSGGRLELSGRDFSTHGANGTVVGNAGTVAARSDAQNGAAGLLVNSALSLSTGSILELDLPGNPSDPAIELGSSGLLKIASGVTLKLILEEDHTPQAGEEWILFGGETTQISGAFDLLVLPDLAEGLSWDLRTFNETGGWRVGVIPEASAIHLALAAVLPLLFLRSGIAHRRRRRLSLSQNMTNL